MGWQELRLESEALRVNPLGDPAERSHLGRAGREAVRDRFLTPRELEDYIRTLAALAA